MTTLESTTVTLGACPHDCPDTCSMTVTVDDGRVTKVRGTPDHPFTQGGLCVKVTDFPNHIYAPDRVVTPLRRIGPKGEGRFEPISWDAALDEIADRYRSIIAEHGAEVTLACRNLDSAREAAVKLPGLVEVEELDLASLKSVHAFADRFDGPLDLLVNNAGVMRPPKYRETEDGFELQFGTNHLGHFALTGRLLPLLLAAPAPRVVVVSSGAHRIGAMRFEDLQSERSYSRWGAYGQSKLANLLFARELGRRCPALLVAAAHPGSPVPADPEALAAYFTFTDFAHFIEVYLSVADLVTDADDVWTADKLELQVAALRARPNAGVAYSWVIFVDEDGRDLHPRRAVRFEGDVRPHLLLDCFPATASTSEATAVSGSSATIRAAWQCRPASPAMPGSTLSDRRAAFSSTSRPTRARAGG